MGLKKITEMPAATTPLAGTELAVIVQGGIDKNVPVNQFGTGNVSKSGTPTVGQYAQWTDSSHIQGVSLTPGNVNNSGTPTAGQYAQWVDATHIQGATISGTGVVDWINVKDYGAVGDNVHDDTTAIQAAIDTAFAGNISTVYMPSGIYLISSPIYLDPPSNLRAHGDTAVTGGFTMCLMGDEGSDICGYGTRINSNFNNIKAAIIVGTGQGMKLKNLWVTGPNNGFRANMPQGGVGIGYVGGGTQSRTHTENVAVSNFYCAFRTGLFGDGLNDSNTWIKCFVTSNCALGIWISQTQNFINSAYDCNVDATTGVLCSNGGGIHIFGGNWSSHAATGAALALSSVSALTATSDGNSFDYSFTATVASNIYLTGPTGVYNAFCINTTHFGPVPCTLTAFNSGTNQATFQILGAWSAHCFGTVNAATGTDLQAELQAATIVYCAERVTTFRGSNISVIGVHIENDVAPTCFFKSESSFGGDRPNLFQNVFFNGDSALSGAAPVFSPTAEALGRYYIAHTFPWIEITNNPVTTQLKFSQCGLTGDFHDPTGAILSGDPVPIDVGGFLLAEGVNNFRVNVRNANPSGAVTSLDTNPQVAQFDRLYFFQLYRSATDPDSAAWGGPQSSPHWAYRPAMWATPAIHLADFTTLNGALPAFTVSTGPSYPLIWGGQIYRKAEFRYTDMGAQTNYHFLSKHNFYSYGQDITTTVSPGCSWSYKGQSPNVYMDSGTIKLMRQGLGIILNDGSSDVHYIVTGVYPGLGFIQVAQGPHFGGLTSGSKTAIISGTLIKQDPYVIQQI